MAETARQLHYKSEEKPSFNEADLERRKKEIAESRDFIMNFAQKNLHSSQGMDKSVIEDITQNVLRKAVRFADKHDPSRGKLTTWLAEITKTTIADYFRSNKRDAKIDHDTDPDVVLQETPSLAGISDPFLKKRVEAALERLKPTERDFLTRSLNGASYEELGREFNIKTTGSVGSRLSHIKKKLKDMLKKEGINLDEFFGKDHY